MNQIINVQEERTIGMVTMEIKTLQRQAEQVVLGYAIEIGRRLTEAKQMLPHGAWGPWLRDEVHYSKSTANNFMRIFDEYADDQIGIFGAEAKSQTLGNLSYTKALRLLAIPEEEREEFAQEHHVEELSTRELDRLIRERDEARAGEVKAQEQLMEAQLATDAAIAGQETLQKEFAEQKQELEKLCEEYGQAAKAEKAKADAALARADKADAAAKKAKEQLKKLKENPEIPQEAMDKVRAEAEQAAGKKMEDKLKQAKAEADAAAKAAKEAAEKAEEARRAKEAAEKRLALANTDVVLLNAELERLQESFNRCHGILMKIAGSDPAMAEKLKTALPKMLDSMRARL